MGMSQSYGSPDERDDRESIATIQSRDEVPAPGKLVDIGGRRIQIDCRGSGSPTVVFEDGLDVGGSTSWMGVHESISKTTRAAVRSVIDSVQSNQKSVVVAAIQ